MADDTYTIALSGPAGYRQPAIRALQAAGIGVDDTRHTHGFEPVKGVDWVTCHGHPDRAAEQVAGLGWQIRAHYAHSAPLVPAPADPAAELADLKRLLAEKGVI